MFYIRTSLNKSLKDQDLYKKTM